MKTAIFVLACTLAIVATGAYALHQKKLLSTDVLRLYAARKGPEQVAEQVSAPAGPVVSLREKERQLELRYQEARQLDERIKQQKRELDAGMAKLDVQLRTLVQLDAQAQPDDAQMLELVKIYEGMEPEQAASIMENLPDASVANILLQMRRRQAAQVMEALSTGKGVAVSARILPDITKVAN